MVGRATIGDNCDRPCSRALRLRVHKRYCDDVGSFLSMRLKGVFVDIWWWVRRSVVPTSDINPTSFICPYFGSRAARRPKASRIDKSGRYVPNVYGKLGKVLNGFRSRGTGVHSLSSIFPSRRVPSPGAYLDQYAQELVAALASIRREQLNLAVKILEGALESDATIFCCGNGGSAAIANHMLCDHQKGINAGTHHRPRVVSLSSNVEMATAVSNDIGFSEVFAFPLVAISSSGDSENIVRALAAAANLGMRTIALTGFDGGRSRGLAEVAIHVDGRNYGVIEDAHQACMHVMAQYLRHLAIAQETLGQHRF